MKCIVSIDLKRRKFLHSECLQVGALVLFSILIFSCGRADLNLPIGEGNGTPQPVTGVTVENFSGASILRYNVPNDNSVNYVEAVYEVDGGETRRKGSFYTNTLLLDGFPDSREYKVSLYSVSHSEVRSAPVEVTVYPDTPPYIAVAQNLHVSSVFGGVKSTFKNPTQSNLQITFLERNELGKWGEVETVYTSLDSGTFYVRNLESRLYTFGVVCRDKWQHVSDTLTVEATPLYEELVDQSLMASYPLPTDITYELPLQDQEVFHKGAPGATDIPILWNGETHAPFTQSKYIFFQNPTAGIPFAGLPSSITIDLGKKYLLSRLVYWPRASTSTNINYTYIFGTTHVRTFELWGSNDPSPDGSYESWTKIGDFESLRPSGNTTPGNEYSTEEDRRIAVTGENYNMPEEIAPYRYIRYRVFSTWGAQPYWSSTELQFFGNAAE